MEWYAWEDFNTVAQFELLYGLAELFDIWGRTADDDKFYVFDAFERFDGKEDIFSLFNSADVEDVSVIQIISFSYFLLEFFCGRNRKYRVAALVDDIDFLLRDVIEPHDIPFGTLADGDDAVGRLACLEELIRVYVAVSGMVILWKTFKYQVMNSNDTFYLGISGQV